MRLASTVFVLCAALLAQTAPPAPQKDDAPLVMGESVPTGAIAMVDEIIISEAEFIDEALRRLMMPTNLDGRRLLEGLVQEALISAEANRRNLTVSDAETEAKFAELEVALKKAGTSLEAEMTRSNVTRDTFVAKLRTTMLLERLTREDLRVPANETVTGAQQQTWIKNRAGKVTIETDRAKLPAGVVATADGIAISARSLVRMAVTTGSRREMIKAVDTVMQHALVRAALGSRSIKLTEADLEANVARKKATFAENPQFSAIDFAEFIKQQTGADMAAYRHSLPFMIDASIWRLGAVAFSDEEVSKAYTADMARFGPVRTVRHLLLLASDSGKKGTDGKPLPTTAKATEQILAIRKELEGGAKTFESLARLYSEDKGTKFNGGKLPPFAPASSPFHISFTEAALTLTVGAVSGPVVTPDGVHLITLEKLDPAPPVKEVEVEIREALARKLLHDSWTKAKRGYDIRLK